MDRLVVEAQNTKQAASAGCSRLVEGDCWDHTDYPGLGIAMMRSFANYRGLEDVGYRLNLVPQEEGDGKDPVLLELAVCDPNDHNEGHLPRVAEVTVGAAHLVFLIARAPGSDHWRLDPFEFR